MLVTSFVPPELAAATERLSHARRVAVLDARAAWIDGGLRPAMATRHAVAYANRIYGQQASRLVVQKHAAVGRAAATAEQSFVLTFKHAVYVAQSQLDEAAVVRELTRDTQVPLELNAVVDALRGALA